MATVCYQLDTRREKKNGTHPIELYIRHRSRILISTDFCAAPGTWTGTEYNKETKGYEAKDMAICNLVNHVETLTVMLDNNQKLKSVSDTALKDYISKSIKNGLTCKTFVICPNEFIEIKTEGNTIELYKAAKNKILAYDPAYTSEIITREWLEPFDKWLKDTGMRTNSASIHLRNIKAALSCTINNEETELYPFRKFVIEKKETRGRPLRPERLVTLQGFSGEKYQKEYQDIFILISYLTGINAVDLFSLKQMVDGRMEYEREKAGRLHSIGVGSEAMEIVDRYKGNKFLLNTLETNDYNYRKCMAVMNRGLQKLGGFEQKGLGEEKIRDILFPNITLYWMHHIWATIAHKIGASRDIISLTLGYEFGCKTAGIYADYDLEQIDKANRKVIGYINSLSL